MENLVWQEDAIQKNINSTWVIKSRSVSTRKSLRKEYLPSWTEETFTIAQRLPRNPPVYRLKEANGDLIQGTFYETELQRVIEKSTHLFHIEKILKSRGKGKKKEVLVHWKGWPKSYDSWLPASQLVSLQRP